MVSCCTNRSHTPSIPVAQPEASLKTAAKPAVDPKLGALWNEFGFPPSILTDFPECAKFLKKSRWIFFIQGYRNSANEMSSEGLRTGIKTDPTGHPLLFVQGIWMRWDLIQEMLTFDEIEDAIVSKANPKEVWNYFWPDGLQQKSFYGNIFPIHRLSPAEYQALKLKAGGKETQKSFVQLFTNEYDLRIPTCPLLNNLRREIPSHVGQRLIDHNGIVYSIGFGLTPRSADNILSSGSFTATDETELSSLDVAEYRPFIRRTVTTVPTTQELAEALLVNWKYLSKNLLRFNFVKRNCAYFGNETLKILGIEEDFKTTLSTVLFRMIPSLKDIPLIGGVLERINQVVRRVCSWIARSTPQWVKTGIRWIFLPITWPLNKISTLFINLIALSLGASKQITPLRPEAKNDPNESISFSRLFSKWTDLFDENTSTFYYSSLVKDWQNRQPSTVRYEYQGPKLYIVPPQGAV